VRDGNRSLIRAVEKLDFSRGNKFSTYASWAIMKNFARTIPEEYKRRDRFRTSQDELFTAHADERPDSLGQEQRRVEKEADTDEPKLSRRQGADLPQQPHHWYHVHARSERLEHRPGLFAHVGTNQLKRSESQRDQEERFHELERRDETEHPVAWVPGALRQQISGFRSHAPRSNRRRKIAC
jgi:hypothetical protein